MPSFFFFFLVEFFLRACSVFKRKRQKLSDRVRCSLVISLTISREKHLGDVKLALNRLESARERRVAGGERGRKEKAFPLFFFFPFFKIILEEGGLGEEGELQREFPLCFPPPAPPKSFGHDLLRVSVRCSVKQHGGVCKCLWTFNFGATEPEVCSPPAPLCLRAGSTAKWASCAGVAVRQSRAAAVPVPVRADKGNSRSGRAPPAARARSRCPGATAALGGCRGWVQPCRGSGTGMKVSGEEEQPPRGSRSPGVRPGPARLPGKAAPRQVLNLPAAFIARLKCA